MFGWKSFLFSVYLVRIWPKSVWAEEGGGWKRFLCIVIGILEYWKRFGQGINLLLTILLNRFCCCWKLDSTWFCAPLRLRRNILVDKFSNKWTPPIIIYTENNAENWVNTILDQWSVNKLYKTRRQVCWCTLTLLNSKIVIRIHWWRWDGRKVILPTANANTNTEIRILEKIRRQ